MYAPSRSARVLCVHAHGEKDRERERERETHTRVQCERQISQTVTDASGKSRGSRGEREGAA